MKLGNILRVGIFLLGLWFFCSGMSAAVYYTHAILSETPADWSGVKTYASGVFGYAVVPLVFALSAFGFGGWLSRCILGSAFDESVSATTPSRSALTISIRLLALYLFGSYGGPMIATVYEFVAWRAGNQSFTSAQVTSDLISNGVGLAFTGFLAFRTDQVAAFFSLGVNRPNQALQPTRVAVMRTLAELRTWQPLRTQSEHHATQPAERLGKVFLPERSAGVADLRLIPLRSSW